MEITAVATRERRKRVHSTKCPCCSHEQGKPELKARYNRKRKGEEINTEEVPLLKTKRSSKSAKSKKAATVVQSTDLEIYSSDFREDENLTPEGRVSTPVCTETSSGKEKSVSQKPVSQRKTKVKKPIKQDEELVKQEGATDSDDVKSGLSVVEKEEHSDLLVEKNVTTTDNRGKAKAKTKKQLNKVGNQSSKSFAKSGTAHGSEIVTKQKEAKVTKPKSAPKNGKQKVQVNSKVTKNKCSQVAKTKGFNIPTTAKGPKKTYVIEKFKVRAFDQLKEKLEIAIDGSSISVPECAEGMQRTGNVTNMDESTTEKPITKENAVSENLYKAAHALVSFRIASAYSRINLDQKAPSSAEFSNSSAPVTQAMVKNHFGIENSGFPNQQFVKNGMGNQFDGAMSAPRQTAKDLSSTAAFIQANAVEEIVKSPSTQSTIGVLSTSNQVLQRSNLQAVKSSITESSAIGLSSSSPLLTLTNQLLQTANPLVPATNQFLHMTKSLLPKMSPVLSTIDSLLPTTNEAPRSTNPLIPTANQLLQTNSALPTTNPQIPTTNQLFSSFPNASAIQTPASNTDTTLVAISPGLPVLQAPNVLVNQPQLAFQLLHTQGTNPPMPTVMTKAQPNPRLICPNPTTLPRNTTPSQQPTTLLTAPLNQRLLLPKITPPIDQLLLKTVSTTTPHVTGTVPTTSTNEIPNSCKLRPILPKEPLGSPTFTLFNPPLQCLQNVVKATDTSSNVKQAIKRLVNSRTKSTDNPSQQQTTSLLDIAITFNKGFFTANSQSKPLIAPAQNNTEMADKEQAIKALLSLGSEQQMARQGKKGTTANVSASKETVPKKPDDMLVVSDADKGIFKVGDVTIDPQVNTIGKESYTCGKCGKIFTSMSYLARHIKHVCPDMTHRKYKCNHCDKAFRDPFGLKQHVFTHTGERPHKCSQCPKAFYSSNDLRRHSRTHSGERPCKCTHCGKTFATTISLKTHTFIHTDEKPHRCPHCPKTFATSSKLGRHIVTHSEQRPFACSQFPKTYNRSGERPYKCKHCGKTFSTTISLKTHNTFIHTDEKPHRCPHCPKTFATSSKLGRHVVTHSEQRPFACSQFPKTYNRSGDLRRHNLNLHEGKRSRRNAGYQENIKCSSGNNI